MQRARSVFPIFLFFMLLSAIILFFLQKPLTQSLQAITLPLQRWTFNSFASAPTIPQDKLLAENADLRLQIAKLKSIESDEKALRDQFSVAAPAPKNLLPAAVVGLSDVSMMIDKGEADHLNVGDVIVYKDNLIGSISKVSPHLSIVTLLSSPDTSFTAKASKTGAIGVVRAQGNDNIFLDNVVLSDKLEKDDILVTKGDVNDKGQGYPPDLVVGTISSVNKVPSSLFQQAKIKTLIDLSKLRMVFVLKG